MNESDKNLKIYRDIFCRAFNVSEDELNESFTFHDVAAWDSIAHFTLINEIEDAFDIMFETEDILHYGSYLNGIKILKRYGIQFD